MGHIVLLICIQDLLMRSKCVVSIFMERRFPMPRQGSPIIVNGILYKSIAAAARKQKLSHKESTIRSRLKAGWDNDRAFCFDNK